MEIPRWCWVLAVLAAAALSVAAAAGPPPAPARRLERSAAAAANKETCRYVRGPWSECDAKTNARSRTLTLKKGDSSICEPSKTIQKKCKKACRYEKAPWSECSAAGEMTRADVLKPNSDPSCEKSRRITKKCNKNKQLKTTKKDKGRRNRQ